MTDDDRFGRRLGTLLRDELYDVHSAPGLTRRLRGRARRTRLRVGAGAVALVAIAGAMGLLVAPGSDGVHTSTGPELVDVAHVRTQVTDALARSTDYVVLARSTFGASHSDEWTDVSTRRTRDDVYAGDGKRLSWSEVVTTDEDGGQRWLFIDRLNRWWSKGQATAAELERQVRPDAFDNLPEADPESISEALVDGTLEIVGKEPVDGHDTLRLRVETTIEIGRGSNAVSFPKKLEIWVDADNYLPYRSIITTTREWGDSTLSTTYTWSERSPENLKVFDLTPPAGFADRTGGTIR